MNKKSIVATGIDIKAYFEIYINDELLLRELDNDEIKKQRFEKLPKEIQTKENYKNYKIIEHLIPNFNDEKDLELVYIEMYKNYIKIHGEFSFTKKAFIEEQIELNEYLIANKENSKIHNSYAQSLVDYNIFLKSKFENKNDIWESLIKEELHIRLNEIEAKIIPKIANWKQRKGLIECAAFCQLLYDKKYFNEPSLCIKSVNSFSLNKYGTDITNQLAKAKEKDREKHKKLLQKYFV